MLINEKAQQINTTVSNVVFFSDVLGAVFFNFFGLGNIIYAKGVNWHSLMSDVFGVLNPGKGATGKFVFGLFHFLQFIFQKVFYFGSFLQ